MKLSVFLIAVMFALTTLTACKPKAPESASSDNYGTTHEGKAPEGRNELPGK